MRPTVYAHIVSIGNELTEGKITDTNSAHLSELLHGRGIIVKKHITIPDDMNEITDVLRGSVANKVDILVITGGLGPTSDDMTRECICRTFDINQVFDQKAWDMIAERIKKYGRTPAPNNRKQVMMPEGAKVFYNTCGTAPGFGLRVKDTRICAMPGIPGEMEEMAALSVVPYIKREFGEFQAGDERIFKTVGIGESDAGLRLEDMMERQRNPRVDLTVSGGVITVKLTSLPGTDDEELENDAEEIRTRLGSFIWTEENIGFEKYIVETMKKMNRTLALAESCTGGLACAGLVSVPGCSGVLIEGAVTYSNESKISRLGVDPASIQRFGAVSEQVAREMAQGILERSGADISGAVTGIAGPDGGTPEKPPGTVWLCAASGEAVNTLHREFTGPRQYVRERSVIELYAMIRKLLLIRKHHG